MKVLSITEWTAVSMVKLFLKETKTNLFSSISWKNLSWIREFEQKIGKDIETINVNTHEGKRLRGELLVRLKDWGGLTYGEINKIPPFDRLKQGSLGKLYLDAKARLQ